jgi:hypothetical protein
MSWVRPEDWGRPVLGRRLLLFGAILLPGLSCGSGDGSDPSPHRSAKGGILFSEHSLQAVHASPQWRIEKDPVVTIGASEGEDPYRFFRVRDAALLDDRIFVIDGGSAELRVFQLDGTHIRSVGGGGDGPGEFRFPLDLIRLAGDSIAAWDNRHRRVSFFDSEGTFARSVHLVGNFQAPSILTVAPDGSFLVLDSRVAILNSRVSESSFELSRYDSNGFLADSIGSYSLPNIEITQTGRGVGFVPKLFRESMRIVGDGETFWISIGSEPELERRSRAGDLIQGIRWETRDREVRREHVEAYWAQRLAEAEGDEERRTVQRRQKEALVAARFPVVDRLFVDRSKRVWVRQFKYPTDDTPPFWLVFFPDGEIAGRIRVPEKLRIFDAGAGFLLGTSQDDLGVEYVHLFEIRI